MIIVVGAGASGLVCSYKLAKKGFDVLLLEKTNEVGKKILITGKGRCNLTNNCTNKEFIENVVRNPKFLYSAINSFNAQDTMKFFEEELQLPLMLTRGNRVFPASFISKDVVDALYKGIKKVGVSLHLNEAVRFITKNGDIFKVTTTKGVYDADKVIIATGGLSYPLTGSTGDGYKIATSFKHSLVDQVPALAALKVKEDIDPDLFKFTQKNVNLNCIINGKKHTEFGDITFYKEGIAGPASLTLSSLINRIDPSQIQLSIDFKPALTFEQLDARLVREIQTNEIHTVKDLLKRLLPGEIIYWFAEITEINLDYPLSELTKDNRKEITQSLKEFKLHYLGIDDISRATVTSGGVNVNEIDSKTFESKIVKGLYFIGEVLDVDAFTGGFNLQIAFSTAASLAEHVI